MPQSDSDGVIPTKTIQISLVIPAFEEELQIERTVEVIDAHLRPAGVAHQYILVDDGSRDGTWRVIESLAARRTDVCAVRLSRNFGKEAAICAGLQALQPEFSDACIVMDADLQHPPDVLPRLLAKWREGFHIVEGVKISRGRESIANRIGARVFYRTLGRLSGVNLDNASDLKLLDRKVLESWNRLSEKNTFFRGLVPWLGFSHATVPFDVAERAGGTSKWSKLQLAKLAVNAITSFSSLPLQIVTVLGVCFLAGSLVLGIQTLYMYLSGIAFTGFTTVILLLLIIGSAIMISLGIIGIYISKIFDEVKGRPRFIVAETVRAREASRVAGLTSPGAPSP